MIQTDSSHTGLQRPETCSLSTDYEDSHTTLSVTPKLPNVSSSASFILIVSAPRQGPKATETKKNVNEKKREKEGGRGRDRTPRSPNI